MNFFGELDHEFVGSEFDWIARDELGNFGYFSTAGQGWIPKSVLDDSEPFLEILEAVQALPVVGAPHRSTSVGHAIDDWMMAASRGFFAFDWNRVTRRYELVARPTGRIECKDVSRMKTLNDAVVLPCSFPDDFSVRGPLS